MLPTFVIGLREGLEAALIVGIIAAFLRKQDRGDLIRQLGMGVGAAVAICAVGGLALELFSRNLPQRQQEGLETVIGVLAVGMVTYMVIWMKEHARGLRSQLESLAADALGSTGSRAGTAMVLMAFLAVLREGFETVVFLLAAFNESGSGASAAVGALLGIAVAIALGYGIYRGGVRINLSKFFRATGLVLVLVAGGLVVSALHTAHEAGWLDLGQHRMLDLSWLVQPGSVLSSLLTGMLGIQPFPVLAEVVGWLLYVVPVGVFVAWPPGHPVPLRRLRLALAGTAAVGLTAGITLAVTAPEVTSAAGSSLGAVAGQRADDLAVTTASRTPLDDTAGATHSFTVAPTASTSVDGVRAQQYAVTLPGHTTSARMDRGRIAALNGGRLPIGVPPTAARVPVRILDQRVLTVSIEPHTKHLLDVSWRQTREVQAVGASGQLLRVAEPAAAAAYHAPRAAVSAAAAAARSDLARLDTRADRQALAWLFGIPGGAALLALLLALRRRTTVEPEPADVPEPTPTLINS